MRDLNKMNIKWWRNFADAVQGYNPNLFGIAVEFADKLEEYATKIKKLELEQHMKSNYEKERNFLIEECKKFNLHYQGQWIPNHGHPKLHFMSYGED